MTEVSISMGLCRLCHTKGHFRSLEARYTHVGKEITYSVILQDTFDIVLSQFPTNPSYSICGDCEVRLRDAALFKKQVLDCEDKFNSVYLQDGCIKIEIKEEIETHTEEYSEETINRNLQEDKYNEYSEETVNIQEDNNATNSYENMSSSDEEMEFTPDYVKKEGKSCEENVLPEHSKERYLQAYDNFVKWQTEKREKSLSESVFITYFNELSEKLRPSSLWSIYSMLKSTINTKTNVDLKNYTKLTTFLKRQSAGYKVKQSKVFTAKEVETFLNEAPDEIYLATKVALVLGISGACRTIELAKLTLKDVEKHDTIFLVKLPNTKTKIDRTFVIKDEFVKHIKKYQDMRPDKLQTDRFFLNYNKGRCVKQVMGKNKLSSLPKLIATYLKLPNPEQYTGHCFRRTSAKLLVDSGAKLTTLKSRGDWKSSPVVEVNIERSVEKSKLNSQIRNAINLRKNCDSNEPRPCSSKDDIEDQHQIKQPKVEVPDEEYDQPM